MTTDGLFTPTRVLQHVNTPEVYKALVQAVGG